MHFPCRPAVLLLLCLGRTAAAAASEQKGGEGYLFVVTGCASLKRAIEANSAGNSTTSTSSTTTSNNNDNNTNETTNTSNTSNNSSGDSNLTSGSGRRQGGKLTFLLPPSSKNDNAMLHCTGSIHVSPSQSIVLIGAADGSSVVSIAPDSIEARHRRDKDRDSSQGSTSQGPVSPGGGTRHRSLFVNEGVLRIENVAFRLDSSSSGSSSSSDIHSSREKKQTRRRQGEGHSHACGGARVVLNSGHLVIANTTFDRSLAGPSGCGVMTGAGQVIHSKACGGSILVTNSTFGVSSHFGAGAIIHAAGTETVEIQDSRFSEEEDGAIYDGGSVHSGGQPTKGGGFIVTSGSMNSSGGGRSVYGDGPTPSSERPTYSTRSAENNGRPVDRDGSVTGGGFVESSGPVDSGGLVTRDASSAERRARAVFAGPGVDLSMMGSSFSVVGGGAVSCHGAIIRDCTFVGVGAAVTSNHNPNRRALNRPVVIEGSSFERTAGGPAGHAVVAVRGGDLAITDATFWGVGVEGTAVSFEPSILGGSVSHLEIRRCDFCADSAENGDAVEGHSVAAVAAFTGSIEWASSKVVGNKTVLEIVCNTPTGTGCGGNVVPTMIIDTAKFDSVSHLSHVKPKPDHALTRLRAERDKVSRRRLGGSSGGIVVDQGLLLVIVTIGLVMIIAGLCCLDAFLRKHPTALDFFSKRGEGQQPAGRNHRRTPGAESSEGFLLANGLGIAADKGVYVTDTLPADLDQYNVYDIYDKEISFAVSPGVKSVLERSASRRRVLDAVHVGGVANVGGGSSGSGGGSGNNANYSRMLYATQPPPPLPQLSRPIFGSSNVGGFGQQIEEKLDVLSSSSSIASHLLPAATTAERDAVERGTYAGLYGGNAQLSNANTGMDASSAPESFGDINGDNGFAAAIRASRRDEDDLNRDEKEEDDEKREEDEEMEGRRASAGWGSTASGGDISAAIRQEMQALKLDDLDPDTTTALVPHISPPPPPHHHPAFISPAYHPLALDGLRYPSASSAVDGEVAAAPSLPPMSPPPPPPHHYPAFVSPAYAPSAAAERDGLRYPSASSAVGLHGLRYPSTSSAVGVGGLGRPPGTSPARLLSPIAYTPGSRAATIPLPSVSPVASIGRPKSSSSNALSSSVSSSLGSYIEIWRRENSQEIASVEEEDDASLANISSHPVDDNSGSAVVVEGRGEGGGGGGRVGGGGGLFSVASVKRYSGPGDKPGQIGSYHAVHGTSGSAIGVGGGGGEGGGDEASGTSVKHFAPGEESGQTGRYQSVEGSDNIVVGVAGGEGLSGGASAKRQFVPDIEPDQTCSHHLVEGSQSLVVSGGGSAYGSSAKRYCSPGSVGGGGRGGGRRGMPSGDSGMHSFAPGSAPVQSGTYHSADSNSSVVLGVGGGGGGGGGGRGGVSVTSTKRYFVPSDDADPDGMCYSPPSSDPEDDDRRGGVGSGEFDDDAIAEPFPGLVEFDRAERRPEVVEGSAAPSPAAGAGQPEANETYAFTELDFSDIGSRLSGGSNLSGVHRAGGVGRGDSPAHTSSGENGPDAEQTVSGTDGRTEQEDAFTELDFSDLSSRLAGVHGGGVRIRPGSGGFPGEEYSSVTQIGSESDFTVLSVGIRDRPDLGPGYCSSPSTTDDDSDGSTIESVIDRRGAFYT